MLDDERLNIESSNFDSMVFEEEDLGNSENEITEPFDPKKVEVQILSLSIDNLTKRLLHDEIDLAPDFQRSPDLWPKNIQSRLIESLLINLPIPAFYFDASKAEKWQVVDGLQRLSTLKSFIIDKKFMLTGLEFLKDLNGKKFDQLSRPLQRRIEEFNITAYVIKPGTPTNVKYSLFRRINTGGMPLNHQEIRHAISQGVNAGQASKFLKELTFDENYRKIIHISGNRMSSHELILRHMAFAIEGVKGYKSSLVKFLDDAMVKIGTLEKIKLTEYKKAFANAMSLAYKLFGENAFKKSYVDEKANKVVNKPLFEALSVVLSKLTDEEGAKLLYMKKNFLREFKELMLETKFSGSISRSTANTDNVNYRFKKIEKLVDSHSKELKC